MQALSPSFSKNANLRQTGKLVADKGYISQELFDELFVDGIQLITKIRNNMKNSLMSVADKILITYKQSCKDARQHCQTITEDHHTSPVGTTELCRAYSALIGLGAF